MHTQRGYNALNILVSCLIPVGKCTLPNAAVTP